MEFTLAIVVLVAVLFLLVGFLSGWFSARSKTKALALQMENLNSSIAALQTEKTYLQQSSISLQKEMEDRNGQLMQSTQAATAYSTRLNHALEQITLLKQDLAAAGEKLDLTRKDLIQSSNDQHRLRAEINYKQEQLVNQKNELQQIGQHFTKEFQLLAQKVLDEKTNSFHSVQEKSIHDLLTPLKDNLKNFREEFESKYKTESDERISLREQIKHMMTLNQTLSDQANNLTSALRGQVKQQGNWGEMILESILEYADLKKGIHYFVQEKNVGEEGQALLPDVIIRYPDERSIVIDSKVSLLHYEQYCSAADAGAQRVALNQMQQSVTRHIDGLSNKKYPDAVRALDFVMLFVPVEGAYITLMQANPQVWQYAYKKRVLLISPTNLIAAMKLVYDLWKREGINRNAQEVADKAVRIYEKLAAFVEDFEKMGSQLEKASNNFSEARKKLHTGKGNVIALASQMKQQLHHSKPQREFPVSMLNETDSEE